MTFEKVIEKVKQGQMCIPFKYNNCKVLMLYTDPDRKYFECGFKRFSVKDKCWIIDIVNKNTQNTITLYRTTEELNKEEFDKCTERCNRIKS